ncbi:MULTISPECIES: PAS domain S-box protein [unclassified Archaeoglobus]|jgi:PAS domain S-box-containing protein|uniref:PAS domain S-box protein n=1 Tax=unclassified Archaeoglobus TaxID=2643606 RepID=UPI0025C1C27F|nr:MULTISPECIES: PAS domain S-box protein [unclassified Archaeoglobus]
MKIKIDVGVGRIRRTLERTLSGEFDICQGEDYDVIIIDRNKFEESEKRYRELWENANDILFVINLQGVITDANRMGLEILGYSREDLGNVKIEDIVDKEYLPIVLERIERMVKTRKEQEKPLEVLCRRKDGKRIWLEVRARPLLRKGGVVVIHGIARDITLRKELEERLRESEEMFRVLAEKSLVGIYLIQDGVFQYINPKMAELWGYKVEEIIGKPPMDFVHPEDRKTVERNIKLRIEGKVDSVNYHVRIVRKDGEIRINEVYGSRTIFKGKPAIIGTLVDVTERVKMQQEIEKLNKTLRVINEINEIIAREKDVEALLVKAAERLSELYELAAICYNGKVICKTSGRDGVTEPAVKPKNFVVFPLKHNGEVFGEISVASSESFLDEEKKMLEALAEDIAFALNAIKVERDKLMAFKQIEKNIEQFAILVDQIRNPLAAISLTAELEANEKVREKILKQVAKINELIRSLDEGWLESERMRDYLRRVMNNPKN